MPDENNTAVTEEAQTDDINTGAAADAPEGTEPGPGTAPPTEDPKYTASIYPGKRNTLHVKIARAVLDLEDALAMPVLLLAESGSSSGPFSILDDKMYEAFFLRRNRLPEEPVALLVDSGGGSAKAAYQLATLLRRRCQQFTAIVPRYAKSAATLLVLGADKIILGAYAELGPLDAQFFDREREEWRSALDEVQALERLHAAALTSVDETMLFLLGRTGKRVDPTLSASLEFSASMMRPLLEKIDIVHYTQMSRVLKVAEEYAVRLLQPNYRREDAEKIARSLVENYPEHGFVIDCEEAERIGLKTERPADDIADIMDRMMPVLGKLPMIGRLEEVIDNE